MAILHFTTGLDMTNPSHVGFDAVEDSGPTLWSFLTPLSDDLELIGQGMTFDAQGHALSGTVSFIGIDAGNNNAVNPDLVVTNINVAATTLDDGYEAFWRFLEGNDFFMCSAPGTATPVAFSIFGDAVKPYNGFAFGGHDMIYVNAAAAYVAGDVSSMGAGQFTGGADKIHGSATIAQQVLVGDAGSLTGNGRLIGGNDDIRIEAAKGGSLAVGDVDVVGGTTSGRPTEVVGGNDVIVAGTGSLATLVGDVDQQTARSVVRGGDDELVGADLTELIVGDVRLAGDVMFGGDDRIWGHGGSDILVGDAYVSFGAGGKVVGGNDVIHGGEGGDRIFGDTSNDTLANVTGGNDELYGEAGNDFLAGGGGNDFIVGGAGADYLIGGTGNDTLVVDSGDTVVELAGEGIDTVMAAVQAIALADNVENLSSLWLGDFTAFGNALANVMVAGTGEDYLVGGGESDTLYGLAGGDALFGDEGSDTLIGGAGADLISGGDGIDTASYAGAAQGVKVALDGSLTAEGDALGDTLVSIERLGGSDHRDVMRGDANANVISGGGGNDSLQGGGGNDTLVGGAGKDALLGGAGNDRFDFLTLTDGGDTVADFGNVAGNDDALRFEGDVFGGLPNGVLAVNRFVANAAGVATSLDQRFVYETDTGILRYDANGSAAGGVTVIATLTGAPSLTAGDILIV
jgi:Ca2+-binding RTX toxin-like protein